MAAKKKKKNASPPKKTPFQIEFWREISINRRLDIFGTVLGILGVLTIFSLLSENRSPVVKFWVGLFEHSFGWGAWVIAFSIIVIGIWLVVRNQESIPQLTIERVTGLAIIFLWLLPVLQLFTTDSLHEVSFAEGKIGGGYLGSLFMRLLQINLGALGTAIMLLAWLLIGTTITLDMSVPEFFSRISPFFIQIYELWKERIDEWLAERYPQQHTPPVQMGGYDPAPRQAPASQAELPGEASDTVEWYLPPVEVILDPGTIPSMNEEFITQRAELIEETLESFGAPVKIVEINRGPTITQFGVEPGYITTRKGQTRVRVNKISSLADDLALALAASRIRIQAPVPGKGYVGIEVPNEETSMVALRDILESDRFDADKMQLGFALGRDVAGYPQVADLTRMPHLLIAGTTGSGKSVCVNAILTSMLLHKTPDELRFVLVDPKRVELTNYNGIPHLLTPVVVDTEKVIGALQWMTREMDKRYHEFAQLGARNITEYNARIEAKGGKKYPYLVIVIDELADLMMIAPTETESTITRLAQLSRATGIHMILATQRPSVDVVTGLIKANFPARIAFAVASGTDSRVILDQPGAERLLGRGDMLYQAPDAPSAARLQGVFISDIETARLVDFWRVQAGQPSAFADLGKYAEALPQGVPLKQVEMFEDEILNAAKKIDPLFDEAVDICRRQGRASVSMLQRKLRIGYTRASRLVDEMEDQGIVGPPTGGTGVRDVLDYGKAAPPVGQD